MGRKNFAHANTASQSDHDAYPFNNSCSAGDDNSIDRHGNTATHSRHDGHAAVPPNRMANDVGYDASDDDHACMFLFSARCFDIFTPIFNNHSAVSMADELAHPACQRNAIPVAIGLADAARQWNAVPVATGLANISCFPDDATNTIKLDTTPDHNRAAELDPAGATIAQSDTAGTTAAQINAAGTTAELETSRASAGLDSVAMNSSLDSGDRHTRSVDLVVM